MRIVLLEGLGIPEAYIEENSRRLQAMGHSFEAFSDEPNLPTLLERVRGAQALILGGMQLPLQVLQTDTQLEFIDVAFTGTDQVPVAEAQERGIVVSHTPGYATEAVAELCLGFMIDLLRHVPQVQSQCRHNGTRKGLIGSDLQGRTVGIVGAGRIGCRVAELSKAFGCHTLAFNRSPVHNPAIDRQVALAQLLQEADIVSLHVPLTSETRGLISAEQLAAMKPSAYLINTARGEVVDSNALVHAIRTREIAGAALDVFDMEPPLPKDLPVLRIPRTIVTPHIGFATQDALQIRAQMAFENLYAWLDGSPIHVVQAAEVPKEIPRRT